jgi:hypothetical protein
MSKTINNKCKKTTFLLEKEVFEKIAYSEKLAMCIHLMRCHTCRLYKKDSQLIRKIMTECFETSKNNQAQLSTVFKNRLAEQIKLKSG